MKYLSCFLIFISCYHLLAAAENQEFRATWVVTWEHISPYNNTSQNMALAREIIDNHHLGNFNAILWQCRQSGTAYYNSQYEPWGYYAGGADPGYDPLALAIEEAHSKGMELHAWFNVFHCSSTRPGTPAGDHPEWVCTDENGVFMTVDENGNSFRCLSPGLEEVREYLLKVAMEIVRNYDIDGIHLDFIRWNEYTYHPSAAEKTMESLHKKTAGDVAIDGIISEKQLKALHENQSQRYIYDVEHPASGGVPEGFNDWDEWRRWTVTEFVQTLHDSIQAEKPWVRLSVAALGRYNWGVWQGYGDVFQDAALWFNEGYVEQLTPMHYHWLTANGFYDMLTGGCPNCWSQYIQPGIEAGRMYSVGPGSYLFERNKVWNNHPAVIEMCRTIPWVDGFQFFRYQNWQNFNYFPESRETFFHRKNKIRPIYQVSTPEAPSITLNKNDELNYQIDVTPPPSIVENQWYAVYRSENTEPDVTSDQIVDIHFGNTSYSVNEQFDGLQDFNAKYTYYATTLNRFWNESAASNTDISGEIPSYPPVVVKTVPAEGETISINSPVQITFSKNMDLSLLKPAIEIIPAVNIENLYWKEQEKTAIIEFAEYFQFDTDYTLIIQNTAVDLNGVAIDGNADGTAGDAFELHFRSSAVDDVPPSVVQYFPDYRGEEERFDVDDIVTVVFNEPLDETTLTEEAVRIFRSSNQVATQFLHTFTDGKSVISIQPEQPYGMSTNYTALLSNVISDTTGNALIDNISFTFTTTDDRSFDQRTIDEFSTSADWKQPGFSGSTVGIVVPECEFGYTRDIYLPATQIKRAASLKYKWDTSQDAFLLRDYLGGGAPRAVEFDTSYVLQCYVFGDGSNNKFRFCLDEAHGANWPDHEVSKWYILDWYGWRLLQWDLSDSTTVGEWISPDNKLNGTKYRVDSFQLTHDSTGAVSGRIYFDDFRLVKRTQLPVHVAMNSDVQPLNFKLKQNYPNPFNPITKIPFEIAKDSHVSLSIYNVIGRKIITIVDRKLTAGYHEVQFDGARLSSGIYIYRLDVDGQTMKKRMMLLK